MLGKKTDILGMEIQKAAMQDGPTNRFVLQNNYLGMAETRVSVNHKARLVQQRNVPPVLMPSPNRPIGTSIRMGDERATGRGGGIAYIPDAGLYRFIGGGQ